MLVPASAFIIAASAVWSPPIQISSEPRIYVVDDFATAEECADIYASAAPHLETSLTSAGGTQADSKPQGRSSQQYTMNPASWSARVASVVERMDRAALMPAKNGQHLTVTNYGLNDHYEVHVDSNLAVGRLLTALLFLEQPEEGGELIFPWARPIRQSNETSCADGEVGRSWPDGVRGAGRPHEDYYALRDLPKLDEVGMCEPPTDVLRIEPRVGRLVLFFNHDHEGRMLRPTTLVSSPPTLLLLRFALFPRRSSHVHTTFVSHRGGSTARALSKKARSASHSGGISGMSSPLPMRLAPCSSGCTGRQDGRWTTAPRPSKIRRSGGGVYAKMRGRLNVRKRAAPQRCYRVTRLPAARCAIWPSCRFGQNRPQAPRGRACMSSALRPARGAADSYGRSP